MNDKRLDDLLQGMKKDYDKLPEYTNTTDVLNKLFTNQKKPKRNRLLPYVAVIAGLFLFFILVIPMMDNYQQAEMGKEYLEDYYEEKKEDYRKELGIPSVEGFDETKQALSIVERYEDTMSREEVEEAKQSIDMIFITPNQLIEEMNNSSKQLSEEKWNQLFRVMGNLNSSLDDYFSEIKVEYGLDAAKQQELLENQYDYNGPIEIVEFLNAVHVQGYQITKINFDHQRQLQIRVDYENLVNKINNWEGYEGFRAFLNFIDEKVDIYYPGIHNAQGIPWYEFDELLLELEAIYTNYPENWDFIVKSSNVLYFSTNYLDAYLAAGYPEQGDSLVENIDVLKNELQNFEANHQDSIYWPIISTKIQEYEENNWNTQSSRLNNELFYLFSSPDELIDFDQMIDIDLHRWPLTVNTSGNYNSYKETNDLKIITELSSIDFLSMYLYASEKDEALYQSLYSGEGEQQKIDWFERFNTSVILLENQVSEEVIDYTFIGQTYKAIATIQLVTDGNGWEVKEQKILE